MDVLLLLALLISFNKNAISMAYHEIAGLAIIAAFVIHHLINRKWIGTITGKLFSKNIKTSAKVSWVVDALMFVCWLLIGISGVLISHVVFHFNVQGMTWKTIHYFCAALSIILTGIHLGLHTGFIGGMWKKLPAGFYGKAAKGIGLVLLIAVFAFGCYSFTATSFSRWISMPFASSQMGEGMRPSMTASQNAPASANEQSAAGSAAQSGDQSTVTQGTAPASSAMQTNGSTGNNAQMQFAGHGQQSFSFSNLLNIMGSFLSMIVVCAVITSLVSKLFKRKTA